MKTIFFFYEKGLVPESLVSKKKFTKVTFSLYIFGDLQTCELLFSYNWK